MYKYICLTIVKGKAEASRSILGCPRWCWTKGTDINLEHGKL